MRRRANHRLHRAVVVASRVAVFALVVGLLSALHVRAEDEKDLRREAEVRAVVLGEQVDVLEQQVEALTAEIETLRRALPPEESTP